MLSASPSLNLTGLFHIYGDGFTEKFNYGDCGPVKITATANSLLFYGHHLLNPLYTLYQRDRIDAADPLSVLWYSSLVSGAWFHNLPLDESFSDPRGAWISMRSSWTDTEAIFVAMKAGQLTGHQTRTYDGLICHITKLTM